MSSATASEMSLQSPTVIRAAIQAIHWLVLNARREALDWTHGRKPADHQRMVNFLDAIDSLTDLIKHNSDGAFGQFQRLLDSVGHDYPEFSGVLDQFNKDVAVAESGDLIGS